MVVADARVLTLRADADGLELLAWEKTADELPRFTVETRTAEVGDEVTISIDVSGFSNVTIEGMSFEISYHEFFLSHPVVALGQRLLDWELHSEVSGLGRTLVQATSSTQGGSTIPDGEAFTLTFTISNVAPEAFVFPIIIRGEPPRPVEGIPVDHLVEPGAIVTGAFPPPIIDVGTATALPGETVRIAITVDDLKNPYFDIFRYKLTFEFDTRLEEPTATLEGTPIGGTDGWTLLQPSPDLPPPDPGTLIVEAERGSSLKTLQDQQPMAYLCFTVPADAFPGEYLVRLADAEVVPSGTVRIGDNPGFIEVEPYPCPETFGCPELSASHRRVKPGKRVHVAVRMRNLHDPLDQLTIKLDYSLALRRTSKAFLPGATGSGERRDNGENPSVHRFYRYSDPCTDPGFRTRSNLTPSTFTAERHGFEYYRHGTLSLCAELNTWSKEEVGRTAPRHTSAERVAFDSDVVAGQPRTREIHLIVDNIS